MAVPAGWMPDPHVAGQLRYFDGRGWTPQTAPLTESAPPAPLAPAPVPQAAPTVIAPPPAAPTAAPAMAPPAAPDPVLPPPMGAAEPPTPALHTIPKPDAPTAASRLASRNWRWGNSLWLLLPLVSFGFLTWAGFLYIGIRTSNKLWLGFAGLYFVLIGIVFVAAAGGTPLPNWAGFLMIAIWIGGFVHSVIVNKQFLLSLVSKAPWYIESAPSLSGPSHRGS